MKQGYYKPGNSPLEIESGKPKPKTMRIYYYFKCKNCLSTWSTLVEAPYSNIVSNGFDQTEYDYCDDCKEIV